MAGFSNTTESNILQLILNATAWANVADNASSSPFTNWYVALHTADPGDTGTATTSESAYTSYARVAVARTSGGWTISGTTQVANAGTITFPACTGSTSTITHFSLVTTSSGAGTILFSGTVTPNLAVSNGITPSFAAGALVATLD